ncbi:MAG TPA: hypothetical protein PLA54_02765 [Spirochaetota bacterium]|nr:hypothetical protein [Spirochaetota bacterium]
MKLTLTKAIFVCMLLEAVIILISLYMGYYRLKNFELIQIDTAKTLIEIQGLILVLLIPVGLVNIALFISCLVKKKWKTSLLAAIAGIVLLIFYLISLAAVSMSF